VVEYLEGETLAQRLHRGPLAMNDILNAAVALADALTVAHTAGVIHRDRSPCGTRTVLKAQVKASRG